MTNPSQQTQFDQAYAQLVSQGIILHAGGFSTLYDQKTGAEIDLSGLSPALQDAAGIVQNAPKEMRLQAVSKTAPATQPATPATAAAPTPKKDIPTITSSAEIHDAELRGMYLPLETKFNQLEAQLKASGDTDGLKHLAACRANMLAALAGLDSKLVGQSAGDRTLALQIIKTKIDPLMLATDYRAGVMPKVNQSVQDFCSWVHDDAAPWAKKTAEDVIHGTGDVAANPGKALSDAGDKLKNAGKTFKDNLNAGSVVGGLGGAALGFFISSLFGNGPLKWVLMVLLTPLFMILGSQQFGPGINNFFKGFGKGGKGQSVDGQAQSQQVGMAQGQETYLEDGTRIAHDPYLGNVRLYGGGHAQSFGQQMYDAGAFPQGSYHCGEVPQGYQPAAPHRPTSTNVRLNVNDGKLASVGFNTRNGGNSAGIYLRR